MRTFCEVWLKQSPWIVLIQQFNAKFAKEVLSLHRLQTWKLILKLNIWTISSSIVQCVVAYSQARQASIHTQETFIRIVSLWHLLWQPTMMIIYNCYLYSCWRACPEYDGEDPWWKQHIWLEVHSLFENIS